MKVALIGGHLTTALAIIEALPKETEVFFIGRQYTFEGDKALSLEYRAITQRNIPFYRLITGRLQRRIGVQTVPSLIKIPYGFSQALLILRKMRPDIVVGFGGYLSVPVIWAAYFLRIPVVIHEQTFGAGLANKTMARYAQKICISWESSRNFFPKNKTVLTGNPLRSSILTSEISIDRPIIDPSTPVIYITGGSSGSHAINELIFNMYTQLIEKYTLLHQTGDADQSADYNKLLARRDTLPLNLQQRSVLTKFIDPSEVGWYYNTANLVISRSGVNTITELLYFQKPALLIPLPYGQKNEQQTNAEFLRSQGLAEVLVQSTLSPEYLVQKIDDVITNLSQYTVKDISMQSSLIKHAASHIVEVIIETAKK